MLRFLLKSLSLGSISQNITYRENLEAPIEKGEVLGTVSYVLDGNVIKSIDLVAEDNVKRLNLINITGVVYNSWFSLLR